MSALRATIDRFVGCGNLKMVIAADPSIWCAELALGLQELIRGHASMPKQMLLILAGNELNEFMVPPVVEAIAADNIFVMAFSNDLPDALSNNRMKTMTMATEVGTLLVAGKSLLNVSEVLEDGSVIAEVCDDGCWMSFCNSTELTREQVTALPQTEPRSVCAACPEHAVCATSAALDHVA